MSFTVSILHVLFFLTSTLQERLSLPNLFSRSVSQPRKNSTHPARQRNIENFRNGFGNVFSSLKKKKKYSSKWRQTEDRFLVLRTVWKIIYETDKSTALLNTFFFSQNIHSALIRAQAVGFQSRVQTLSLCHPLWPVIPIINTHKSHQV